MRDQNKQVLKELHDMEYDIMNGARINQEKEKPVLNQGSFANDKAFDQIV
jgi:hypothetical protein